VAGSAEVENLSFVYDVLGNLAERQDVDQNLSESLVYDKLNRLTQATITGSTASPPAKSFAYDLIGNITSKSDVGTYGYPPAGSVRPHAVVSIGGGEVSATFAYDENGNMVNGLGRTIGYSAFNQPTKVTQGTTTVGFNQGPEHQRILRQDTIAGTIATTLYMAETATGTPVELHIAASGALTWTQYLMAGDGMVGFVTTQGSASFTRYFHTDHLGSVAVLTDDGANVVQRLSYDPWGKQRNAATWADDVAGALPAQDQSTRGFTGQEQLDDVGLVHLNARLYDPQLGRFASADSLVDNPYNAQALNRYSYVYDNPLSFTDPTGHGFFSFIGSIFKAVFTAPLKLAGAQLHALGSVIRSAPIIGTILQIAVGAAATVLCEGNVGCGIAAAAGIAALTAGVTSGKIGVALQAGAIAAGTAAAFAGIGDITAEPLCQGDLCGGDFTGESLQFTTHDLTFLSANHLANIVGHTAIGCAAAAASGAGCGSGALAGGITSFAGPVINQSGFEAGLVANTALGGVASVAGGGKFANGAITAAFGYLFNAAARDPITGAPCLGNACTQQLNIGGGGVIGSAAFLEGQGAAQSIANAARLAEQLAAESAASPFTAGGTLTDEAIAASREIIPANEIGNPGVPQGFAKYSTSSYQSPSGDFQVHFYYNVSTSKAFYDLDYKVKFNQQR
jgi:RHS repeat-associated protein